MSAPSGPQPTHDPEPTRAAGFGSPEIGPALKRDRLLQRVRAARKRLAPAPGAMARLR